MRKYGSEAASICTQMTSPEDESVYLRSLLRLALFRRRRSERCAKRCGGSWRCRTAWRISLPQLPGQWWRGASWLNSGQSMQSEPRKAVRGVPAEKTVLLYVTSTDDQLVERARQLGVAAVAVPALRQLTIVTCTEEVWLRGRCCQLRMTPLLVPDRRGVAVFEVGAVPVQQRGCSFAQMGASRV